MTKSPKPRLYPPSDEEQEWKEFTEALQALSDEQLEEFKLMTSAETQRTPEEQQAILDSWGFGDTNE